MPTLICGVQRDLFRSLFPTKAVPSTQPVDTAMATLATVNVVLPVLMAVCSGPAPCSTTTAALKRAAAAKSSRQWADEVCGELSARGQPTVRELARALCTLRPTSSLSPPPSATTSTTTTQSRALTLVADQCSGIELEAIWLRMPIAGEKDNHTGSDDDDIYVVVGQDVLENIEEPTSQRGLLFAVHGDEITSIEEVLHANVIGNVPLIVQSSSPPNAATPVAGALELDEEDEADSIKRSTSSTSIAIPSSFLYPRSARDAYSGSPLPHDAIFASTLNNLCDQPKIRAVCGKVFSALGRRKVGSSGGSTSAKLEDLLVPKKAFKTFLESLLVTLSTSRLETYLSALSGQLCVGARQRLDALVASIAEQVVTAELSKLHIVTAALQTPPPPSPSSLNASEATPTTTTTTTTAPPPSRGVAPILPGDSNRLVSQNARPQPCIAFRDFYRALVRVLLYFVVVPPTPTRSQCELPSSPFDAVVSLIQLNAYPIANIPPPVVPTAPSKTTGAHQHPPSATASSVPVLSKNATVGPNAATVAEEMLLLDDTVDEEDDSIAAVITNGSVVGFGSTSKSTATIRGGAVPPTTTATNAVDQKKKNIIVSKQELDDRRRRLQLLDSYPVQRGVAATTTL